MLLVEIETKRGNYNAAGPLVSELLSIYIGIREPDIIDWLGYIRTLVAFACLSSPGWEAILRWTDVLTWGHLYNPLDGDVFICGLVYLFLCLVWYELGDADKSRDNY